MLTRRESFKQVDAKLVLFGARSVGKSAIAVRFLTKRFIGEYDSSQDFTYQFTASIDDDQVNLEVLDPSFQCPPEVKDRSVESKAIWADGIIVVYSVTDRKSFDAVAKILRLVDPFRQKTVFAIVGNKSDLAHERQVSFAEGAAQAEKLRCLYFECSASESYEKVADMFHGVYREVTKKKKEKKMPLSPRPLRHALGNLFRRNSSKCLLLVAPSSPTTQRNRITNSTQQTSRNETNLT